MVSFMPLIQLTQQGRVPHHHPSRNKEEQGTKKLCPVPPAERSYWHPALPLGPVLMEASQNHVTNRKAFKAI